MFWWSGHAVFWRNGVIHLTVLLSRSSRMVFQCCVWKALFIWLVCCRVLPEWSSSVVYGRLYSSNSSVVTFFQNGLPVLCIEGFIHLTVLLSRSSRMVFQCCVWTALFIWQFCCHVLPADRSSASFSCEQLKTSIIVLQI